METANIFQALKAKFSDAIVGIHTENPDPYITVKKDAIFDICHFMKTAPGLEFDFLESLSGVDMGDKLQVVYHLFSYKHRHAMVLKTDVAYDNLLVASVSKVWAAANWHEREQYDLFGFQFSGHPDLRRLLLPEDWVGHPLRKNYEYPDEYHGIDHYRPDPKDQFKALDELVAKARDKKQQESAAPETSAQN